MSGRECVRERVREGVSRVPGAHAGDEARRECVREKVCQGGSVSGRECVRERVRGVSVPGRECVRECVRERVCQGGSEKSSVLGFTPFNVPFMQYCK